MAETANSPKLDRLSAIARVMTLIGIIDQLYTTRATAILKSSGLPYPRFSLLHHFSHNPKRGWTIGELARVMEMNQPAITKLVQRLEAQNYLRAESDAQDGRIKRLFMTDAGQRAHADAIQALGPETQRAFESWPLAEIEDLRLPLERLKAWLDDTRRR
jgi:DNA-binding MarR family transcriptional regulator